MDKMHSRSSPSVAVVAPKDRWILDKLATRLTEGIEVCTREGRGAYGDYDLVYFVPYYYWTPTPTKAAAFFTHLPTETERQQLFFRVAEHCDYGVAMAPKYLEMIVDWRKKCGKSTDGYVRITPEPEACFTPRLRLVNVGKLYAWKRQDLLESAVALPFVELTCTRGELSEEEVVQLYQTVDYTLITATVEGGPMCMLESLACGTPVIAPDDVGLVPQFRGARNGGNVYKYRTGDWPSLKDLLCRLYERKLAASAEVERVAPGWVTEHVRFFEMALGQSIAVRET